MTKGMNVSQVYRRGRNGYRQLAHLSDVTLKYTKFDKTRSNTTLIWIQFYVRQLATVVFDR